MPLDLAPTVSYDTAGSHPLYIARDESRSYSDHRAFQRLAGNAQPVRAAETGRLGAALIVTVGVRGRIDRQKMQLQKTAHALVSSGCSGAAEVAP